MPNKKRLVAVGCPASTVDPKSLAKIKWKFNAFGWTGDISILNICNSVIASLFLL